MDFATLARGYAGEVAIIAPLPEPEQIQPQAPAVCRPEPTVEALVDVIRAINRFVPAHRTQLADLLGLSRKEVAALLRQAYDEGLVTGQRHEGEILLRAVTAAPGEAE